MKKEFLLFIALLFGVSSLAQQAPTNNAPSGAGPSGQNNQQFWSRAGNTNFPGTNTNNIFGTLWNSPIYTVTFGVNRTKLNGNFGTTPPIQYPINGFTAPNVNTSGYFLLGNDIGAGPNSFYSAKGAFTLLHLNGNTNNPSFVQDGGYRPWMKTGITFTDNQDRAYIGYRSKSLDVSDLVINWSDNSVGGPGTAGPDNLIFNFTSYIGNDPNNIDGNQPDGREVARMTGYGNMGIGPRFNNTQVPAAGQTGQPQSLLHLSNYSNWASWLQIGNESTGGSINDGFRIGVSGSSQDPANPLFVLNPMNTPEAVGTAMIYNQANRALLFSTGKSTNAFTGTSSSTQERFRIMALSTATQLAGALWLPFNPGNLSNTDVTRASLSHDPDNPVNRPLSLFHLGYNASITLDGWRNWMDVGTYIGYQSDNMYVGMKRVTASQTDAVINWGNDVAVPPGSGAMDHLLFVFTQNNGGSTPGSSNDGLEVARMASNGNFGRIGIGSFDLLGIEPQNTVHINSPLNGATAAVGGASGLRFEDMNTLTTPIQNPGKGILAVDADGDVIYVNSSQIGNYCNDPNPTSLTGNYQFNLSNNNMYFYNGRSVLIGEAQCGNIAPSRVFIRYSNTQYHPSIKEGLRVENNVPTGNTIAARFINYGPGLSIHATGNMFLNGIGTSTGGGVFSDSTLKTNVNSIQNASVLLNAMNPVSFYYDSTNQRYNFPQEKQYGFIAQQVEQVNPDLVSDFTVPGENDSLGNVIVPEESIKVLNYNAYIALLTQAFKEQQKIVDSLKQKISGQDSLNASMQDQINAIYNMLTECCSNRLENTGNDSQSNMYFESIELRDEQSIVLDQNVPNPFAEQTSISYYLPETVNRAQILFYNAEGKLINSVELKQKGKGQINVFAQDLSNGIYTYTLIADGEIIASKKMLKQ